MTLHIVSCECMDVSKTDDYDVWVDIGVLFAKPGQASQCNDTGYDGIMHILSDLISARNH